MYARNAIWLQISWDITQEQQHLIDADADILHSNFNISSLRLKILQDITPELKYLMVAHFMRHYTLHSNLNTSILVADFTRYQTRTTISHPPTLGKSRTDFV